jgi:hypothetical protein
MGLAVIDRIPKGEGELIAVEHLPIMITPNAAFYEAKSVLQGIVEQVGGIANSITTDDQYNQGIAGLQAINKFLKDIEAGIKPSKDQLNQAKDQLIEFAHQLDVPAKRLKDALSAETGRYRMWKDEQERREQERLRKEAELERQRKQREVDIGALKNEIVMAESEAADAEQRGEVETAKEIRAVTKRYAALDSMPGAFPDPLEDATRIRQAVLLARQHEEARIAAAKAKAEGDRNAARRIERAAAKLEAPEVAPVISERVEAAPVVAPKADLTKAKGQSTRKEWKLKGIYDPAQVPREYLRVDESALNAYAKRCGEIEPHVPGCRFEFSVKTIGVRG